MPGMNGETLILGISKGVHLLMNISASFPSIHGTENCADLCLPRRSSVSPH